MTRQDTLAAPNLDIAPPVLDGAPDSVQPMESIGVLDRIHNLGSRVVAANRRRGAALLTAGSTLLSAGGGLLLLDAAIAEGSSKPPYPPGGCFDNGLNASGGVVANFVSPNTLQVTPYINSNAVEQPGCENFGWSMTVSEAVQDNSGNFTTNTPNVTYTKNNQTQVQYVKELVDSTTCLPPDNRSRLRLLKYAITVTNEKTGESHTADKAAAFNTVPPVLPPNTQCTPNTNTADMLMQYNAVQKGTHDVPSKVVPPKNKQHDLPPLHGKTIFHKPGFTLQLRGNKVIATPTAAQKAPQFEVIDKSKKKEDVRIVVKTQDHHRAWKQHLEALKAKRDFFRFKLKDLKAHTASAQREVVVEAFDPKGHMLYEEIAKVTLTSQPKHP